MCVRALSRSSGLHFAVDSGLRPGYSATYRHGSVGHRRFQIVKNGTSRVEPDVVTRIVPMLTPRSPVEATITCSGAHEMVVSPVVPALTDCAIACGPRTNAGLPGPPVFTASGAAHFSNACPIPICPASLENACSARLSSSA